MESREYIVYEDEQVEIYGDREFTCTKIGEMQVEINGHLTDIPIQLGFNGEPMATFYYKDEKYTLKIPWHKFRHIVTKALIDFIDKADKDELRKLEEK